MPFNIIFDFFLPAGLVAIVVGVGGFCAFVVAAFIADVWGKVSARTIRGKLVRDDQWAIKLPNGTVKILSQPVYHEGAKKGCNYTLRRAWWEEAWFATPDLEADKMDAIRAQIDRDLLSRITPQHQSPDARPYKGRLPRPNGKGAAASPFTNPTGEPMNTIQQCLDEVAALNIPSPIDCEPDIRSIPGQSLKMKWNTHYGFTLAYHGATSHPFLSQWEVVPADDPEDSMACAIAGLRGHGATAAEAWQAFCKAVDSRMMQLSWLHEHIDHRAPKGGILADKFNELRKALVACPTEPAA
jgi:hypothetical protein